MLWLILAISRANDNDREWIPSSGVRSPWRCGQGHQGRRPRSVSEVAKEALDFAFFTLQIFHDLVLQNEDDVKLITSDTYTHKTYYIGLVDDNNNVNFSRHCYSTGCG